MKKKYCYIGCDIGSTSVKTVCLGSDKKVFSSSYVKNEGIIESVKKSFEGLNLPGDAEIKGFGITGSGRSFGSALLKADIVKTEILAHAKATVHYHPEARTVFEIGGEDCKLIMLDKGKIRDFQMNTICGGGTGAMIESIASRIGVSVDRIGDMAVNSRNEVSIAGKCGIFAQSTVVNKINLGVCKEDILMGVCRALVSNYFAMLAKGKKLEGPFVFQGATAFNRALVKCFEEEVSSKITVPPYPHLMGAIGMALYLMDEDIQETKFLGFESVSNDLLTRNIKSDRCANRCEITYLYRGGEVVGSFGNRCEACAGPREKEKIPQHQS